MDTPTPPPTTTQMISFPCPACAKGLKAPEDTAGRVTKCPGCGGEIVVPRVVAVATAVGEEKAGGKSVDRLLSMAFSAAAAAAKVEPSKEPATLQPAVQIVPKSYALNPLKLVFFVKIAAWLYCLYQVSIAWSGLSSSRIPDSYGRPGGYAVADVAMAILVATSGYIVARIVAESAEAIARLYIDRDA